MSNNNILGLIFALLIPFAGTTFGSAFVFFMKKQMSETLNKTLLGFASGVMIAASVWSLLIPSMNFSTEGSKLMSVLPTVIGFFIGIGFLLLIDKVTPHLHNWSNAKPEGIKSRLSRTTMLNLAVTIHNLPEGMAVGVLIAGVLQGGLGLTLESAMVLSIGIALQNIPEGAIISMPMRAAGHSRTRSFIMGSLSGIVEPIGGLLVIWLSSIMTPVLPYMLSFAAGAMFYVTIEDLIPSTAEGEHSDMGTIGFSIGFVLMMVMDVVLG